MAGPEPPLGITSLPPEILEKIFNQLSSDPGSLRCLAGVCAPFRLAALSVAVRVQLPLTEKDLAWLRHHSVPVRHLRNCELAAYVGDQVVGLNLSGLRSARLVGYDYQSRRCEVTPHYLALLLCVSHRAAESLRTLHINVDFSRTRRGFRFAEVVTSLRALRSLSIHFSSHIELNQRILNNNDTQSFIDLLLANLPRLVTFNIYICPARRLRVASRSLRELGVYKSDSVEVVGLDLPNLHRLSLHESTAQLFRRILADREAGGATMHRNLLSLLYDGCPRLRMLNDLRLPMSLRTPRPARAEWSRGLNKELVRQYREQAGREEQ
jgi:hypothetical protein